jgi:hypothetical protein
MNFDLASVTEFIQLLSGFFIAITALVAAIIGIIKPIRRWFMNIVYKTDRIAKLEESVTKINTFIDEVKDDLHDKIERDKLEQHLMKEAITAVTRNDLTAIYNRAIEKGYISDYDRENFEKMYKVYSDLGGNSYIHEVHDQILKMPTRAAANKRNTRRTSSTRR